VGEELALQDPRASGHRNRSFQALEAAAGLLVVLISLSLRRGDDQILL
jgi:hypothetical protein